MSDLETDATSNKTPLAAERPNFLGHLQGIIRSCVLAIRQITAPETAVPPDDVWGKGEKQQKLMPGDNIEALLNGRPGTIIVTEDSVVVALSADRYSTLVSVMPRGHSICFDHGDLKGLEFSVSEDGTAIIRVKMGGAFIRVKNRAPASDGQ